MQPQIGASRVSSGADSLPYHMTFQYTGNKQVFKVPAGVTALTVDMRGAGGDGALCPPHYPFRYVGRGGRVFAVIPVTPHQRLIVYVGGVGGNAGGFNGGGSGGSVGRKTGGGGGASDVRVSSGNLRDRILVAGGGGGEGSAAYGYGCSGSGGGDTGGNGSQGGPYAGNGGGGGGGTQNASGSGGQGGSTSGSYGCVRVGNPGSDGKFGAGGAGGKAPVKSYYSNDGRGGGGGGGGSGYAEPSATKVRMWNNWKRAFGNGLVVFSWQ